MYFVGGSGVFADCSLRISLVNVVYLRIVCCVFRWWEWCICGLFVAYFVGECGVFADCLLCVSLVNVVYLRIVRNVFRCVNIALL